MDPLGDVSISLGLFVKMGGHHRLGKGIGNDNHQAERREGTGMLLTNPVSQSSVESPPKVSMALGRKSKLFPMACKGLHELPVLPTPNPSSTCSLLSLGFRHAALLPVSRPPLSPLPLRAFPYCLFSLKYTPPWTLSVVGFSVAQVSTQMSCLFRENFPDHSVTSSTTSLIHSHHST